ncbi:hypothetical protein [Hydrogenophaga sp.]
MPFVAASCSTTSLLNTVIGT